MPVRDKGAHAEIKRDKKRQKERERENDKNTTLLENEKEI